MNKLIRMSLVGVISLAAAFASKAAPTTIMPVGDSLTANDPGYRGPLLAALRGAGHEVEFVGSKKGATPHEGFGGFTIGPGPSKADAWSGGKGNIHAQLDGILAKNQPDVLILLVGVNDYFNIKELEPGYDVNRDGAARLGGVLDKIHALSPKTRVLYSSILPVAWDKNFAKKYNVQLPALAASRPFAVFVDLNTMTGLDKGDWSKDGLHLDAPGNEKVAKGWAAALEPVLKELAAKK
ncbi:MAG: hypothetical protein H7067_14205 [Burkholderiales bacterium]|nr:hypothetical protein [Opitutaceae bacterium]